jgi:putative ATP-binding cassette transporter
MDTPNKVSPTGAEARLLSRFWRDARRFWIGRSARTAWSLTGFLVLLVVAQLLVQYFLNLWNRNFFDALAARDAGALWVQAQVFVALGALSTALAATAVWGRMTAQRKWRECVTKIVAEHWLARNHSCQLNPLGSGSENPEYRISEDVRIATDAPVDLVLAFFSSVLTSIVFFSVLWEVGGTLAFEALGRAWSIPGYLVIAVAIYSGLFSTMMMVIGHRLTGVIEQKNQAEAEFRAAADLLRRNAPPGTEDQTAGRRTLWRAVHSVLLQWRNLCWQLVRTTVVSHGIIGSGGRVVPVRAQISCRYNVAWRAHPGRCSLRHRAERIQLAGRQLSATGGLAIFSASRCHAADCH